jgi:ATP-binding protein involved in chromosome partitioning
MKNIKNIIAVGSGKGGVGKSTVTTNLAAALNKLGFKVGILDADIYGPSIPRMMGALNQKPDINDDKKIQPIVRHGIKLMSLGFLVDENLAVVWRGPMLFKALEQLLNDVNWGELDYLLIDLPPGTGDVSLTLAQKTVIDQAIVVCTPQNIALTDAKKAVDMFEKIHVPIFGVVENMAGFRTSESEDLLPLFPKGQLDTYFNGKNIVKRTSLAFNPHLALSCESGIPFVETSTEQQESKNFTQLAKELSETQRN